MGRQGHAARPRIDPESRSGPMNTLVADCQVQTGGFGQFRTLRRPQVTTQQLRHAFYILRLSV